MPQRRSYTKAGRASGLSATVSEGGEDRADARLEAWLAEAAAQGGEGGGGARKLAVGRDGRGGRCLVATQDVEKEETLVLCPRKLLVTSDDAARMSERARAAKNDGRPPWHVLAAFLLDVELQGPDHPFTPYVNALPEYTPNVCTWSRGGVDEWMKRASPTTYALADALYNETNDAADFLAAQPGAPARERCIWALSTVLSRMARLPGLPADADGLAPLALVPYADMLNHDASLPSGDRDGRRVTLSSRLPSQARGVLQSLLQPDRDAAASLPGHLHYDESSDAVVVKAVSFEETSLDYWDTGKVDPRIKEATSAVLGALFNRRKSALGELEVDNAVADDAQSNGGFRKGDEVFVSYGTRASGDLLLTYGFAPTHESNAYGARAGLLVGGVPFTFDINPRGDVAEIPVGFLEACDQVAQGINDARRTNPPPEPLAPAVGLDVAKALIEDALNDALRAEVELEEAIEEEGGEAISRIAATFGVVRDNDASLLVEDLRRVFESEARVWQRAQTSISAYERTMGALPSARV